MLEKVSGFTKEYHMIEENDRVIAGVSGGADSVCLLLLLLEMQKEISFSLRVVHVEHGIRGKESREDAEFVESLCKKAGVGCQCFFADAKKTAQEKKCTLEEAARLLRYGILEREAKTWGRAKIAVAHHQEDDAETILFHLVRGSGLRGMCGIAPVRGNIIRPLLHVSRGEILDYLGQRGQEYRTDSTNGDICYSRNKIRCQIMPLLRELNEQAPAHMQRTADIIKEAVSYLARQTEEAERFCVEGTESGFKIREEDFFQWDAAIRREILWKTLCALAGSEKDIESVHLEILENLFSKQVGKQADLPYRLKAYRVYEGIELSSREREQKRLGTFCFPKEQLEQAGEEGVRCGPFWMRVIENQSLLEKIPKKTYTKWLNYDMIKSNLLARTRREGDYFVCNEQGDTQKLKRYFVNERIEAGKRDEVWLLADGSHILWIVGHRISARYKIREDTRRILEVRFDGGKEDDGISSYINFRGRGKQKN